MALEVRLETGSAGETEALGRRLGELAEGDLLFALQGPLGAGKTVLARGIISGLGVPEGGESPSFILVQVYRGRCPVYHLDLFRLTAEEAASLEEYLHLPGVKVVEWAERIRGRWPKDTVEVELSRPAGEEFRRVIRLSSSSPAGENLLRRLEEGI